MFQAVRKQFSHRIFKQFQIQFQRERYKKHSEFLCSDLEILQREFDIKKNKKEFFKPDLSTHFFWHLACVRDSLI